MARTTFAVLRSYRAYHALIAAARHSELFRCAASIYPPSGATAPIRSDERFDRGPDGDGKPDRGAKEITVPVMLACAQDALIVPKTPFTDVAKALRGTDGHHSIIEYELERDHLLHPPAYRVDGMTRLADFLNEQVGR